MARTDQPDLGLAGPGRALPPPVAGRHRLSTGHVVMIVSGLLATLLTYSVLRQAGGQGTEVLVASDAIRPGQTADPSLFSTARVRASSAALKGIVTPGGEATIMGRVAVVDAQPRPCERAGLLGPMDHRRRRSQRVEHHPTA